MPYNSPGRSDVHVNRPLTQVSLAFMQSEDGFVADRVFPTITTDKKSNSYFTYDRGEFNRDTMKERAPATESAGDTYTISTDTYQCVNRAVHKDIPEEIRDNADEPLDLDSEATRFVTLKEMLRREIVWRDAYFVAGDPGDTWTFDVDGDTARSGAFDPLSAANNNVIRWELASSQPIEDIREGKRFVGEATGFRPNILTLGRLAYDVLLDHPDIVGRIDRGQTSGVAVSTREGLAALFELEEIHVMDAIQNTAAKGQTAVHAFIGANNALLSYRPASPGLLTPSAGYTFAWTGRVGSTANGTRIKRFEIDEIESTRIEIQSNFDQKLTAADLGYFFGDIAQTA